MSHPSSSSYMTPSAVYSSGTSPRSVEQIMKNIEEYSQEINSLRVEILQLERQERQLVDHVLPPLVLQHQTLTLASRKAQEESGIVRRHKVMLQDQRKQLHQWLQADRREMEEVAKNEVRMEHERVQKKRFFTKDMEKKNEELYTALRQIQEHGWYKLLTAETAELLWNKVVTEMEHGADDNGSGGDDDKENGNSFKMILEPSIQHLTQAWTQFHELMNELKGMQDEKMQLRAFLLEQRDEHNGGGMVVMEEELMEMEQAWEQQQPQEETDGNDDPRDGNVANEDEDRLLMPPPPPPAHMQLFYGTQSSQSSSPPDTLMTMVSAGRNGDSHHMA